jgi:hypothetical protein
MLTEKEWEDEMEKEYGPAWRRFTDDSLQFVTITKQDGTTITEDADGNIVTTSPDGTVKKTDKNGSVMNCQEDAMHKMIFFNIGWMDRYDGLEGDAIAGGGSHVDENMEGGEVYNFRDRDGVMYGCVQPSRGGIRLERLGAKTEDESIDNVLVVWLSHRPGVGTVIVGWHKDARVYRDIQRKEIGEKGSLEVQSYYAEARTKDCTLLSIDERVFTIPRRIKGGIGQSNVWFADQSSSQELRNRVLEYIAGHR